MTKTMPSVWDEIREIDISLCGKEVRGTPPGKAAMYTGTVLDVEDGGLSVEFRGLGTRWLPKDDPGTSGELQNTGVVLNFKAWKLELKNPEAEQEIEQYKEDRRARQAKQDALLAQQQAIYAAGPYPLLPQAEEILMALQTQLDSMDLCDVMPWERSPEYLGKHDYHREKAKARHKAARDAASAKCQEHGKRDFDNELNRAAVEAAMAGDVVALREAAGGCFASFEQHREYHEGTDEWWNTGFFYGAAGLGEDFSHLERLHETRHRKEESYTLLGMAQVAQWSDDVLGTLAELGVPETWWPREVFPCTLQKTADDAFSVFDLSGSELSIACSPVNTVKEVAENIRLLMGMECDGEVYILLADGTKAIPEQLLRDVAGV